MRIVEEGYDAEFEARPVLKKYVFTNKTASTTGDLVFGNMTDKVIVKANVRINGGDSCVGIPMYFNSVTVIKCLDDSMNILANTAIDGTLYYYDE